MAQSSRAVLTWRESSQRLGLTCAGAPVVGLAHPLMALTQRPKVGAGLGHVTDADAALTPAPAVAQGAPWGLPRCSAPALRLGPGQPAGGARRASEGRQKSRPGQGSDMDTALTAPSPIFLPSVHPTGMGLQPDPSGSPYKGCVFPKPAPST